ncbi:hypothetical protein GIB67_039515 [Kingdonia uniflora]|uniref:Uncharacterized protein n=1 Tax=Kingdonia uniflora TaxID=39325 RepID=A0A7J7LIP3_9MAGN|nr:hypothetical protein GIB67_039515 [Kingdonia uniflora]
MEPMMRGNSSPMKAKVMFIGQEAENQLRLTELDGKGHFSTSVATTSARVRFKCRSVLVKLREMYLILIEVPHLKQKLKATNLMSLFDCKIGNSDNQVIMSMVERGGQPLTHFTYLVES